MSTHQTILITPHLLFPPAFPMQALLSVSQALSVGPLPYAPTNAAAANNLKLRVGQAVQATAAATAAAAAGLVQSVSVTGMSAAVGANADANRAAHFAADALKLQERACTALAAGANTF